MYWHQNWIFVCCSCGLIRVWGRGQKNKKKPFPVPAHFETAHSADRDVCLCQRTLNGKYDVDDTLGPLTPGRWCPGCGTFQATLDGAGTPIVLMVAAGMGVMAIFHFESWFLFYSFGLKNHTTSVLFSPPPPPPSPLSFVIFITLFFFFTSIFALFKVL